MVHSPPRAVLCRRELSASQLVSLLDGADLLSLFGKLESICECGNGAGAQSASYWQALTI